MVEEILILKFIINAHHSILSAVRRLPPEILGEIFLLALPDVDYIDSDVAEHIKGTPWLLSHVCRRWRAAIQGNPLLWSNIHVDTINLRRRIIHTFREDEHPLRALETQITLSDNAPLFDVLPALHLLSCLTDQLAHLQRLVFHPYGFRYQLPPALGSLFALAPSLREALLTSNDFTDPSPPLDLPWHQLTRLRLRSSQAYTVENLPKAVNLRDCAIAPKHHPLISPSLANLPLVLPNVRRLTLCEAPENWLKLDTPLLDHLHLQSCTDIVFQIMIHLMSNLRSLKLTNIAMSDGPNSLFTVLRGVPAISHLEIYFADWNRNSASSAEQQAFILSFATAMKISNESTASNLSPMLTSLRLVFPYLYPQSDELDHSFFEMVQSRWRRRLFSTSASDAPTEYRSLRRIRFTGIRLLNSSSDDCQVPFCPAVWNRFRILRREGLDVERDLYDNEVGLDESCSKSTNISSFPYLVNPTVEFVVEFWALGPRALAPTEARGHDTRSRRLDLAIYVFLCAHGPHKRLVLFG
ncbi:hypothetical protein R3P38DRAFT_3592278 [Favolaschia claudopus]|uniref:F-box domain-containing protein n=1 Tax=Favolaschia claudopus TaxID=2862362 RepID=A0AAW0AGT0_9AGAR